jgi:hypothetical protein
MALAVAIAALPAVPAAAQLNQPGGQSAPFTIDSLPADTAPTQKYKAGLRLFAVAQAVHQICSECGSMEAWEHYERRNGNTLGLAVRQFGLGGGVREEQKREVDRFAGKVRQDAYAVSACPGLLEEIRTQKWDIYKADRFKADYDLIRAK